jgi:hypothetical protein
VDRQGCIPDGLGLDARLAAQPAETDARHVPRGTVAASSPDLPPMVAMYHDGGPAETRCHATVLGRARVAGHGVVTVAGHELLSVLARGVLTARASGVQEHPRAGMPASSWT